MKMSRTTRILTGASAAVVVALAGCATEPSAQTPEVKGFVVPPEIAEKYHDPLAASTLRERAFDMLAAMATNQDPQLRANSLEAMSVAPIRLEPLIGPALRDENVGVRSTAAMMVGKAQMRNLAPAVRPLLSDPSPFVRASAIYALSRCGAGVDATPLAQLLLGDPSPRVRSHVAFLLGELGESSALGLLREAAKNSMPRAAPAEVRLMQLQLAEAMVKLGDDGQISTVRAALYPSRPEDLEATALAVQILGQIRDKGSMGELIILTAKKNQGGQPFPAEIRLGAAAALARLGLDKGTFLADEYAGNQLAALRAQAAYVYGEIRRPENLAKLEVLMGDQAGIVRVSAAAAVLRMTASPGAAGGA